MVSAELLAQSRAAFIDVFGFGRKTPHSYIGPAPASGRTTDRSCEMPLTEFTPHTPAFDIPILQSPGDHVPRHAFVPGDASEN
jgi:hypothetical protein